MLFQISERFDILIKKLTMIKRAIFFKKRLIKTKNCKAIEDIKLV